MRVTLLTTVAAAALSFSVAAYAQTGGASGSAAGSAGAAAGATSGATSGTTSGAASGSVSGGTKTLVPGGTSGSAGGAVSGSQVQSGTSGTSSTGQATKSTTDTTGKASGTASGSTKTQGQASTQEKDAHTTGSTGSKVSVTSEQRTRISHAFSSVHVEPLTSVNFSISVGSVVPASVTTLHTCPVEVIHILSGIHECRYVVVHDKIVIVEPSSRKIVTVIERHG